jgi:hypothetical protein
MSVPELAEQMGHAPAMTIGTYTHVIRELKGCAEPGRNGRDAAATPTPRALRGSRPDMSCLRGWRDPDSNRGHHDFQSCALPTELSRRGGEDIAVVRAAVGVRVATALV